VSRWVIALSALLTSACPGPPPNTCQPYKSSANLTQPTVSLGTDVLPVFHASCSLPSCHSSAVATGGLALDQSSPAAVRAAVLGVPSTELGGLQLVVAGDPTQSYLMHKMDGDSCALGGCDGGLCSVSMPQGQGLLGTSSRDVIRRWIAQGALDN
jgi:hypothetical protein